MKTKKALGIYLSRGFFIIKPVSCKKLLEFKLIYHLKLMVVT